MCIFLYIKLTLLPPSCPGQVLMSLPGKNQVLGFTHSQSFCGLHKHLSAGFLFDLVGCRAVGGIKQGQAVGGRSLHLAAAVSPPAKQEPFSPHLCGLRGQRLGFCLQLCTFRLGDIELITCPL